ncbi:MAG: hypothetical protein ACO2PN_23495 [Pyrobaculum sp.]|jgi:hypothetical protein
MKGSENSPGGINTRETPSAADAAVTHLETLIDGCVDRETLRKKFIEKFGGDRHAARTYFSLALRRLVNAGKAVVMKSGGSEVICRSGELREVIERWSDLIEALTWKSEGREIDPDMKTNGRIIVYLVRRGMLRALTAFLCRGTKVWAYLDDPVDLSLILDALRHVILQRYLIPQYDGRIPTECRCPNGEITLFVPRRVLFTYMATTIVGEIRDKRYVLREEKYVLKLPGGQTVSLARIKTDCDSLVLRPAVFQDEVLPLVIYFVRVVD